MPNINYKEFKHSVTIQSDDLHLVSCLRGLAWHCQETVSRQVAWGGTKKPDWQNNSHQITFHFNRVWYRENFLKHAERLFPSGWQKVSESNNDPATPQH
jgi:hypothetical protein